MEMLVLLVAVQQLLLETMCVAAVAIAAVRWAQERRPAAAAGEPEAGAGQAAEASLNEGIENIMGYDLKAARQREGRL